MALLNQTSQAYYNGNDYGGYQFVSLTDIINQFMFVYVGEDKIISKASRTDVAFHAQRALAELSFDTLKSFKTQEILLPPTLKMILPQDYVNYTKILYVDSAGIKHPLYPTRRTQNPISIAQDTDTGIYSPIVSGWKDGLTTDTTNVSYSTGVAEDTTNNQVDFTAAPQWSKLQWLNINSFEVGKYYTLTYTISNVPYTDPSSLTTTPSLRPRIIDAFDNYVDFTPRTENGTYTETIELVTGTTVSHASRFYIQVNSDTAFTGSVSNVLLVESADLPLNAESTTWSSYKSHNPNESAHYDFDYDDEIYEANIGQRYGLEPEHAQVNGSFYIDEVGGNIHFSSNLSGQTVVLDYISDSLGTDGETQVHKFAEEAMYKWISHAVLSGKSNIPEYQVNRLKKERFAAVRTAKLRLSSLKLEELTQILRGKSKWIKH
jgi:hypothetical protein